MMASSLSLVNICLFELCLPIVMLMLCNIKGDTLNCAPIFLPKNIFLWSQCNQWVHTWQSTNAQPFHVKFGLNSGGLSILQTKSFSHIMKMQT